MLKSTFKIETSRTWIRPFRTEDGDSMLAMMRKPEISQFTLDEPWSGPEDFQAFFSTVREQHEKIGNGSPFRYFYAVEEKRTGAFIGHCGLGTPAFNPVFTEIFYAIDLPYWHRGFASEVSKALMAYGFKALKVPVIVGFVKKENLASARVLEKIGLKPVGILNQLPQAYDYLNGMPWFMLERTEYDAGQ